MVFDPSTLDMPHSKGRTSNVQSGSGLMYRLEKLDLLKHIDGQLPIDDERIIDWSASLMNVRTESVYLTNEGGEKYTKTWEMLAPDMLAVAHHDGQTQNGLSGLEESLSKPVGKSLTDWITKMLLKDCLRSNSAVGSPDCPTGNMDLILDAGSDDASDSRIYWAPSRAG